MFLLCWFSRVLQLLRAPSAVTLPSALALSSIFSTCVLALVQSGRFLAGQLARRDALIDALLLICLALVDLGCAGLRQNGQREQRQERRSAGSTCTFHLVLLW
jgi:hypothetical protein